MSGRYRLTPLAETDLDGIWDDTADRWNVDQAETYIRLIIKHMETLAARPALGRACPEVRAGYHKSRSGSHILFYRRKEEGIEIVRILHERMDFDRHL